MRLLSRLLQSRILTLGFFAAPHPLQAAAIPLIDPARFDGDRIALQTLFRNKRDYVLKRLRDMGFVIKNPPTATFYLWLDLSSLPKPLNSGLVFFEEALKEKVIVVCVRHFYSIGRVEA